MHLFFPTMFSHFHGTDTKGGPPDGRSNDGLLDTRMLVAHDLGAHSGAAVLARPTAPLLARHWTGLLHVQGHTTSASTVGRVSRATRAVVCWRSTLSA